MKQVVHAACPHDCPDACAVLITVEDGRATKIQGDPEHPITRGFLCGKVAKYLDRVYSPDRVLYPMRRVAPKGTHGDAAFQRITWDEALDEIVARLKQDQRRVRAGSDPALFLRRQSAACSTAAPWTGASSIAWERRSCIAASARRPAETPSSPSTAARWAPSRSSFATRSTSSPGARTFTATTFICGRSSRKRGATARSWW